MTYKPRSPAHIPVGAEVMHRASLGGTRTESEGDAPCITSPRSRSHGGDARCITPSVVTTRHRDARCITRASAPNPSRIARPFPSLLSPSIPV